MTSSMAPNRYHAVSVVPEGAGFIIGRSGTTDFVAVPEIGGRVLQWLQAGHSIQECAAKASELVGQHVDVEEFLADLEAAGVLTNAQPAATSRPPRGQSVGRFFFGVGGLAVQGALAVIGLILLIKEPTLRPTYLDALPAASPLGSLLTIAVLSMALTVIHELAHKLAAARLGVYGRISLGRRLYFIVAQTDLTGLWGISRRKRAVPLVAGMLIDAAVVAVMVILQATLADELGHLAISLIRAVVFINIGALVAQSAIYLRTDLYALILVVTGCQNLWATKGALARRIVGRASADDLEVLGAATHREVIWARIYLALYVPGVLLATWYFVTFTLRVTISLVKLSASAIVADGFSFSLAVIGGAATLALVVVPTTIGLIGAGRSAAALIRRALH